MGASETEIIEIKTHERCELVDITNAVADVVARAGVSEGFAHVWCPHTTAGVTVNESADPDVATDIVEALGRIAPREARYRHREGNADAHVKASLMGCTVTLPVSHGRPALGTWQGVFFCEFDGPRSRRVEVRIGR